MLGLSHTTPSSCRATRPLVSPVIVGLVQHLTKIRPASTPNVLWRFDLETIVIESVAVVRIGMGGLKVEVVVANDLKHPAGPPLEDLVLVEERLNPTSSASQEAPLDTLDVNFDPIDADENADPVDLPGQQGVGELVSDQEVVFEVAQLPIVGAEIRLPAIRPMLVVGQ